MIQATDPVYTFWKDPTEWSAKLARAINNILKGKTNNVGEVTLTANAASTVVTDPRVGYYSVVTLSPTTANAAGAIATTYIATYGDGTFTITHANNAQVDKVFKYTVVG